MKTIFQRLFFLFILSACFASCTDADDTLPEPKVIIKFKFDSTQERLNNFGQPATVGAGNAAQSPIFNVISAHYLEFSQNATTQLGQGFVAYHAPETTLGGSTAIDFSQSIQAKAGEVFLEIPLKAFQAGTYEWLRVSLSYQDYSVSMRLSQVDYQANIKSFIGFNTYLENRIINNTSFTGNKAQGYWEFSIANNPYETSGQAPENATTVPNPLAATSPVPAGSCVVTGKFETPFIITGNEKRNVNVTLSLSTNKSFEWKEVTNNGLYEPSIGENVVDMGIRGLIPTYKK
jgi:hypothetical protein